MYMHHHATLWLASSHVPTSALPCLFFSVLRTSHFCVLHTHLLTLVHTQVVQEAWVVQAGVVVGGQVGTSGAQGLQEHLVDGVSGRTDPVA